MNTVFFDWGGVVANDPGDGLLAEILINLGASDEQVKEIFATYMRRFMRGEISELQYWQALHDDYGFETDESISDEFLKWKGLIANSDILNLIAEVHSLGLQTAILSNVIEPSYNVLDRAGYYDHFDYIIASCKEGYSKPQPEIYQIALDKTGSTPQKSLFIDDKESNLIPAREMGFTTILATHPDQIIADTRAYLESL